MADRKHLVIIGGVAAGMSAAAKVRRMNSGIDVTVYERGDYVSYAACGLPWFICGKIPDHRDLIARSPEHFNKIGIKLHIRHEVTRIETDKKVVTVENLDSGRQFTQPYDMLLIATGARGFRPPVPGTDLEGVFGLRTIEDGQALRRHLETQRPRRAVVVGGGYIGLEVLECFEAMKMDMTVIDIAPRLLMSTFDEDMVVVVDEELEKHRVRLSLSDGIKAFEGKNGRLTTVVTEHNRFPADIAVVALGVRPNVELADEAGVKVGETGAIAIDDHMRTNVPDVYAAGDCAEAFHVVTGRPSYIPLGSTANKQGRVAGTNIAGGDAAFAGVVGTAVSKVFDLEVARTGLTEERARSMGHKVEATKIKAQAMAHYYPGVTPLYVKLVYETDTMRLLGGQIIGENGAAKRIDVLATALHQRMTIEDIRKLDLSYAPPFAPVWDPILVAANVAAKD